MVAFGTRLTTRPAAIPSWDSFNTDELLLFQRQVEIFADFLEHSDYDLQLFPNFTNAQPYVQDTLELGEIVVVGGGWFHHFNSVTDSISLIWNFMHLYGLREFISYLVSSPSPTELKQLAYAYFPAK